MAWTAPRTWVTGEIVTAALMNSAIRDNLLETSASTVTTAGDIVFADAANSMGSRLAIGANDKVLVSDGSVPSWGDPPDHATRHADSGADPIGSGALTDVMMAGNMLHNMVLHGYTEVASETTTSTETTWATVALVIPADWTTWRCFAMASFVYNAFGVGSQHSLIRIDGTNTQDINADSFTDNLNPQTVTAHRTGMTTTGSRSIEFRAWHSNAGSGTVADINFYAQAYQVN